MIFDAAYWVLYWLLAGIVILGPIVLLVLVIVGA